MHEIEEILLDFQAMGISASAIERALDLDQGALQTAVVADDEITVTLLRIIKTYPWILEVADQGYDEDKSQRIMLHNAIDIMMNERHNKKDKKCRCSSIG